MTDDNESALVIINPADWIRKPLPPRQRRDVERIAIADNEVKCRGEALGEIWWRGAQWAVTSDGIEALDGTYVIEKDRLPDAGKEFPWPLHMAGKGWVDNDEFTTAWMVALLLHGYGATAESGKLRALFALLPPWRVGGWDRAADGYERYPWADAR